MGVFSWIALGTLFLHAIPIIRLVTRPLRALFKDRSEWHFPFAVWMRSSGHWEYLLGPLRDRFLSLGLLIWVVVRWVVEAPLTQDTLVGSSLILFFNLLAILNIRYRDGIGLKIAELGRLHANMHPEDFFHLYYALLCPWPPAFPKGGFRTVSYREVDYRTGRPPLQTWRLTLEAVLSTSTFARLVILASQRVGTDYGCDIFDALSRLWGSRLAQVLQLKLSTQLPPDFPSLSDKTLLVFNHQSVLDFGLNFFALGDLHIRSQKVLGMETRHLRPRFIAAKDHFIDNPLLYSWLGLGKVIEGVGMILVNRKQKGKGWQAMAEAAEKLTQTDVEVAVYPQGTRSYALNSFSGERRDAGFYTTCSPKLWADPLGHLKPGTAHLIVESLIKLRAAGEKRLNVLVIGIIGAGIAGPKGSWHVQTEAELQYRITQPWVLSSEEVAGLDIPQHKTPETQEEQRYFDKVEEIQAQLSRRLVAAMAWHGQLIAYLEEELGHLALNEDQKKRLLEQLRRAETKAEPKAFILLDRILSLPTEQWPRFFELWLALSSPEDAMDTESKAFQALLQEVSEKLMKQ